MNKLEKSKEIYDNIQIPDRLQDVVLSAIEKGSKKQNLSSPIPYKKKNFIKPVLKKSMAAAAILIAATAIGVNTNTALAESLKNIPVIGSIVQILILEYHFEDKDKTISIEIPSIQLIKEENGFSDEINTEIYNMCSLYAKEAETRAKEYKESFLATGGTQKEWEQHDIQIKVWYEIKSQNEKYLSFVIKGSENWSSAYAESKYYNLDLTNMKYVTLSDLLGKDYIQIANNRILEQIKEQSKNSDFVFWTKDEGGFQTIDDNIKFYINEEKNPVLVFEKYEIAPGYMGEIEFEIKK